MNSVTTEIKGSLAIVTIDNPPVNATSLAVRKGLLAALHATESAEIRAVILADLPLRISTNLD